MSVRQTAVLASGVALLVCGTVLVLLWRLGIWEYLLLGRTDLRVIFWPSSVMVPIHWSTSAYGILMTSFSVLANCFLYVGIALFLRKFISGLRRSA
jgi:hypothetical protein